MLMRLQEAASYANNSGSNSGSEVGIDCHESSDLSALTGMWCVGNADWLDLIAVYPTIVCLLRLKFRIIVRDFWSLPFLVQYMWPWIVTGFKPYPQSVLLHLVPFVSHISAAKQDCCFCHWISDDFRNFNCLKLVQTDPRLDWSENSLQSLQARSEQQAFNRQSTTLYM